MAYKDLETGRSRDRARYNKRVAARHAAGLCPRCGKVSPEPGRSRCGPCAEKHRIAGRARDARLRAAGIQRRDPIRARVGERDRARRRVAERVAQGLCTKCGRNPPEPDRRMCEPCALKRRKAEREPATTGPRPRASPTAAAMRRSNARLAGSAAGSAVCNGSPLAYAPVVGDTLPQGAALSARTAERSGGPPRGNGMPPAGQKASAANADSPLSPAHPNVPSVQPPHPAATGRRRMPPAANATPAEER